jgi:hypothetical protein
VSRRFRRNFQGAGPLAAGVSTLRAVLIAAVASGLAAAGVSAAEVSLGPTIPLSSGPVPAGDVRFGNGFPEVVVRQASGVLDVEAIGASGLVEPTGLTAKWPYHELWVRDVIIDDAASADLVGRDGGRVVAARVSRIAIDPPQTLVSLPRRYSVLRFGDLDADGFDDLYALDPKSGDLRFIQLHTGSGPTTTKGGHWPRGFTFQLGDIDGDGIADAAGIDAHGRVYAGVADGERFRPLHDQGRIPADAPMVLTEVTGDSHADLVYRRRGRDDVYVRPGALVRGRPGFLGARRLGRWDHRLKLTPTAFGPTLAARDPRTGVVVQVEARRSER